MQGLRDGTEAAYEALTAEYQQPIYNLVSRLLNDPSDSSDVVQEVFIKVFRKIGAFRGESSLKTWIYRIAVNEAYNYKRWFSRHRKQEVGLENDEEGNLNYSQKLSDPGRSPFDSVSGAEQHALIEAALARLNPEFSDCRGFAGHRGIELRRDRRGPAGSAGHGKVANLARARCAKTRAGWGSWSRRLPCV